MSEALAFRCLRDGGFGFGGGKREEEGGPLPVSGINLDVAAVVLEDPLDHKELVHLFPAHPDAVVLHISVRMETPKDLVSDVKFSRRCFPGG